MPSPQAVRGGYYLRDLHEAGQMPKEPTLKWETAKYLGGMLLAGLVSYYATMYGLREEVAILKVEVRHLTKAVDKQSDTIDRLTSAIAAHTAAHAEAAVTKSRR